MQRCRCCVGAPEEMPVAAMLGQVLGGTSVWGDLCRGGLCVTYAQNTPRGVALGKAACVFYAHELVHRVASTCGASPLAERHSVVWLRMGTYLSRPALSIAMDGLMQRTQAPRVCKGSQQWLMNRMRSAAVRYVEKRRSVCAGASKLFASTYAEERREGESVCRGTVVHMSGGGAYCAVSTCADGCSGALHQVSCRIW